MEAILRILKDKGKRCTTQKKVVLAVLKQEPQTVLEILKSIQTKKTLINKVTVYRILTEFITIGIVREIHFRDRETRYELANCSHHHHFVCETCGAIEDISICEDTLLKEVENKTNFKIKSHSLEFFGTCKKCQ